MNLVTQSPRNRYYETTIQNEKKSAPPIYKSKIAREVSNSEESTPIKTAKTIESRTFIDGEDAVNLNDDQIFAKVAKLETRANVLIGVKALGGSAKASQVIAKINEDIAALIAYVDGR